MAETAYSDSINRLIDEFEKMPGIGRRSAERLAYYVLRTPTEQVMQLAYAIRDVKKNVRHCSVCYNVAESDPCAICQDPRRDRTTVCVVEEPKDLISLEKTGQYRGLYHVLMGHISPLDGQEPEDLTLEMLLQRARSGEVREVIVATNPNHEGETTALYLADQLKNDSVAVTRIARGVPSGSHLEYASNAVLADALSGRREMRKS